MLPKLILSELIFSVFFNGFPNFFLYVSEDNRSSNDYDSADGPAIAS